MSGPAGGAWPAHLTKAASTYLAALSSTDQELVRDALAIASRSPYGWPPFQPTDPDGVDVRVARVGVLDIVYWINRAASRLVVLDINRLPL